MLNMNFRFFLGFLTFAAMISLHDAALAVTCQSGCAAKQNCCKPKNLEGPADALGVCLAKNMSNGVCCGASAIIGCSTGTTCCRTVGLCLPNEANISCDSRTAVQCTSDQGCGLDQKCCEVSLGYNLGSIGVCQLNGDCSSYLP